MDRGFSEDDPLLMAEGSKVDRPAAAGRCLVRSFSSNALSTSRWASVGHRPRRKIPGDKVASFFQRVEENAFHLKKFKNFP